MTNASAVEIEKKIEKIIYRTALALDDNDWKSWFDLCDDAFFTRSRPSVQK